MPKSNLALAQAEQELLTEPSAAAALPAAAVCDIDALAEAPEPAPSPAHALQQRLMDGWDESEARAEWPMGVTLFACGAASLALWGVIALGVSRLFS
ncbi:MAG TPA: hypothetical protein VGS12_04410 [Caulobacteraceae bacterium]|nr:hypothetical protein [Caulobacteraceae bacterium]